MFSLFHVYILGLFYIKAQVTSPILNIYKQSKKSWRSGQGRDYNEVGVWKPAFNIHPPGLGTAVCLTHIYLIALDDYILTL